jgi:hypothetical protein
MAFKDHESTPPTGLSVDTSKDVFRLVGVSAASRRVLRREIKLLALPDPSRRSPSRVVRD